VLSSAFQPRSQSKRVASYVLLRLSQRNRRQLVTALTETCRDFDLATFAKHLYTFNVELSTSNVLNLMFIKTLGRALRRTCRTTLRID